MKNSLKPHLIHKLGGEVFQSLVQIGMSESDINKFKMEIIEDIVKKVLLEISNTFTQEDEIKLKDAAATGLNEHQKAALVASLFKKKTGKRPEILVYEYKDEAVINIIRDYVLAILSSDRVTQIEDEKCTTLNKLIDQKEWVEAFKIMQDALKS
jgi:ABC-type branched-subunit amino acid transport system ATPase component